MRPVDGVELQLDSCKPIAKLRALSGERLLVDFIVDPGPAANIDYDSTNVAVTISTPL